MKKFSEHFIVESEMAFSDVNLSEIQPYGDDPDLEYLALKEIGKQGKLAEYIDAGNSLKFGMLKALYHDAIEYKKKREYEKGAAKLAIRIIPMAMSFVFFPVWFFAQLLGTTRAINKIIVPALNMNNNNYQGFIKNLITKIMTLVEGDIKPFLENDWFYDIFYVHDGLLKMVKQEHIFNFALFISDKIEKKRDDEEVPHYWLDNEFRKWLNEKFQLDLPTGKTMIRHKNKS